MRGVKHSTDNRWNSAQVHKLVQAAFDEKYHLKTKAVDGKSSKPKLSAPQANALFLLSPDNANPFFFAQSRFLFPPRLLVVGFQ